MKRKNRFWKKKVFKNTVRIGYFNLNKKEKYPFSVERISRNEFNRIIFIGAHIYPDIDVDTKDGVSQLFIRLLEASIEEAIEAAKEEEEAE